jgi:hypothetical protein
MSMAKNDLLGEGSSSICRKAELEAAAGMPRYWLRDLFLFLRGVSILIILMLLFFLNHPFKWSQVRVYPIQLIVRHRFIPSSSNLQPSVWPWPTSKQICPKSAQGIDLETGQDPLAEIGGSKSSHGGSRWVLAIGFTAASGRKIYHGHGKLPILLCSPHCVGVWPCQPSVLYRPEYSEVVHGLGTQEVAIKVYKTATKSVNSSEDSFYHSLMPLISHSLSKILQTTVVRYQ